LFISLILLTVSDWRLNCKYSRFLQLFK